MALQKALRRWERLPWTGIVVGSLALGAAGCTADPPRSQGREASAQAALTGTSRASWQSKRLPWGKGIGEVGFRAAAPELPGEGPSSIAVGPSGEVVVLDRLNERALSISIKGDVTARASIPRDAEHVAIGPDGALAAWSPLRATVWIKGKDGADLGEIQVPRELRETERIELGISHRIVAVSALQETLQIGSPRAPLDLSSVLRTRREGAAHLADGRGVASRKTESGGEIFAYRKAKKGEDRKPEIGWTFAIEAPVSAVRIVGAVENAVCVRIERVTQATPESAIAVEREALCVEADTGKVLLRQALGRPGIYPVHEELSLGGSPPILAFMIPEEGGLRVERLPLAVDRAIAAGKEVAR